ncbi:MAG TPA: complex I subunit 1 family protein [Candidatus Limnocylindrales bacterium]|nr:complex I subunit 1 family protein [Candidatus Limnocylindrales bacterium]
MSVLARPWSRLTLAGKIVLPLLLLLLLLTIVLVAGVATGIIPFLLGWLIQLAVDNIGIVRFIVAATAVLLFTVPTAFVIIYMEMKFIALMNLRLGPNRVGPWGLLQSAIHGFKVLAKEDYTPTGADVAVFTLAPIVTYLSSVLAFLVLPFAPGLIGMDMNIGLLYFFAMGGLTVLGLLMAGWSSFNKYSLLGGLRAAAQIISYEIPLTLAVVGVIILAGTMSLNQIVLNQSGLTSGPPILRSLTFLDWYVWQQPLAFLIFFIAATAEGNRAPFDLTEADSEIVAGFATEYSGMRFGFFFFAEYVNVFILSALTVVLFLGGWTAPIDLGLLLSQFGIGVDPTIDPSRLGHLLLFGVLIVPPLAILLLTLPIWMLRSDWSFLKSLVVGFILFNVLAGALVGLWLTLSFEVVLGLIWFLAKTYFFVFVFVWMRGTLPRVRVDQLMGFAWKWLLPAALLNLFVTAAAVVVVEQLR